MKTAIVGLVLFTLLLGACGDAGSGGPSKAERAAGIANEISANPTQMQTILSNHGMTAEEFQDLILEITEDPELSAEYEAARKFHMPE